MGLRNVRWRWGVFRILDEGCGGSADEDVTSKKRALDREAEEEGGARSDGQQWGDDGRIGCDKLDWWN